MPKYRVYLFKTDEYTLEVEATDEQAAMEVGLAKILKVKDVNDYLDDSGDFMADDAVEIIDDDR